MSRIRPGGHQDGISLVIVLVLLIASVFLGVSAGVIALQTEKASRGDRDRQVAFQAAEAALIDAQRDIDTAGAANARPLMMGLDNTDGFPGPDQATLCNPGTDGAGAGLCRHAFAGDKPSWLAVDLASEAADSVSIPYGRFTGQSLPVGQGMLPSRKPRYVIELMSYNKPGFQAAPSIAYRITAIGFGADPDTQVVLQTFYRKES